MTDLLTHAEYSAIADALDPPRSPFIDGKYQRGNGPVMATMTPKIFGHCSFLTSRSQARGFHTYRKGPVDTLRELGAERKGLDRCR